MQDDDQERRKPGRPSRQEQEARMLSPEEYRAQRVMEAKEEAEARRLDETVEGGRYGVPGSPGQFVNANGEPISDDDKKK